MLVDGRAIAADILSVARERAAALGRPLSVEAIVAAPTPATESYLRIKTARAADAGMTLQLTRLPDDVSTADALAAVHASTADALIVQLPLPAAIDTKAVLDAIPLSKDADVLSAAARARFLAGEADALVPPVAAAMQEVLARASVDAAGTQAVVVGKGWLVGEPCAALLARLGANVVVHTRASGADLAAALGAADIIVSGAGAPHLIKPDMVKEGVVIIDAGTSESGGALAGDADPACAARASVFTPVPGGMGPIAVACLFRNALLLSERDFA